MDDLVAARISLAMQEPGLDMKTIVARVRQLSTQAVVAVVLVSLQLACGASACLAALPADSPGRGSVAGQCHARESISIDNRKYSPGAQVKITVTALNASAIDCTNETQCAMVTIDDSSGARIWPNPSHRFTCPLVLVLMPPGASGSATFTANLPPNVSGVLHARGSLPGHDFGTVYFKVC